MEETRQPLSVRIDAALASLGTVEDATAMEALARQIQAAYPDGLLLRSLIRHLDQADSQLRGGLGILATLLPQAPTEKALLRTALNRNESAHARLSAVTLLQDFLNRPVEPQFIQDIADRDAVILASMRDMFAIRPQQPMVLAEYTRQFSALDREHRRYVLRLLDRTSPADAVDLLCVMAHSDAEDVGADAVDFLGGMDARVADAMLYVLSQSLYLHPARRDRARALLRRRRMQGHRFMPPPVPADFRIKFMGFDPAGMMRYQAASEGSALHLLLELAVGTGIQQLLDATFIEDPNPDRTGGTLPSNGIEVPFHFLHWHVQYTLAQPLLPSAPQRYPPTLPLCAPTLWRWQPPDQPASFGAFLARLDAGEASGNSSAADLRNALQHPVAQALTTLVENRFHNPSSPDNGAASHPETPSGQGPQAMRAYAIWCFRSMAALHCAIHDLETAIRLLPVIHSLEADEGGFAEWAERSGLSL